MDKLFKLIIVLIVVIGALSTLDSAQAESKAQLVQKGNALFSSGKFDAAIRSYDEAGVVDPESPVIYFNKGTALYKKEDYGAAIDAFKQAAVKTNDISLEAKSKFNLGLCFFREGERQKDSDLKKTLESYESSVQSFQEALALDPKFTEAAENIEMVRLMMKSVLDEIKKQEEAAKKQQEQAQQTAKKINELIEKQKNLLAESQSLINDEQSKETTKDQDAKSSGQNSGNDTPQKTEQNQSIADAQKQLKNDTQNLSEQLAKQAAAAPSTASSGQASPSPEHPAKRHLDASAKAQESAIEQFSKNDTSTAANQQQTSLDNLKKALEAINNGGKNQQGEQQQQQQGSQARQKDKESQQKGDKEQNQNAQSSAENDRQPEQKSQQIQALPQPDDANSILNEEKENQKHRMPFSSGGFNKVDKDW